MILIVYLFIKIRLTKQWVMFDLVTQSCHYNPIKKLEQTI